MKISVCIITKNEADNLRKCLESIKGVFDEIVVVDTGSCDKTSDVISEYADVAGEFCWCNDFSKARNYSISLASNDWILVLDSDEWLEQVDCSALAALEKTPHMVGRICRCNHIVTEGVQEKGVEHISRLFNRNYNMYRGRIHEQIMMLDGGKTEVVELPVVIGHSGYSGTPEEKRLKAERNIELLMLDLEEFGKDPYTLYQLGKSYYMQQKYQEATVYFESGFEFDLDPKLEYVQDMVETYGYALLKLGRRSEMMFLRNIYDEFAMTADYVFLMGLAYMNNELYEEAIAEFEKATKYAVSKMEGCNSYKAYYNAGVICECLNDKERAGNYYRKCGNYEPALKGLERLV